MTDARLTEWDLSLLLAWEELSWDHLTHQEFYVALTAGRLTSGWDGRIASLRGQDREPPPRPVTGRKLGEVPDGWQPPSKESIAQIMGGSRFDVIRKRGKTDGD